MSLIKGGIDQNRVGRRTLPFELRERLGFTPGTLNNRALGGKPFTDIGSFELRRRSNKDSLPQHVAFRLGVFRTGRERQRNDKRAPGFR